jgi:hypothetical protein
MVSDVEYTIIHNADWSGNAELRQDGMVLANLPGKLFIAVDRPEPAEPEAIPMILHCPGVLEGGNVCGARHIDRGDFATKPHATHSCQRCGFTWKPAKVPTTGVEFLPGYKNDPV